MENVLQVIDNTRKRFLSEWLSNSIRNFIDHPRIPGLEALSPEPSALTAVICGSGPSLDLDLDALKRLKSRKSLRIFANHSNFPTLLSCSIVPDFVVVTDSQDETRRRFEEDCLPLFKKDLRKCRFLLPTHVNPKLLSLLDSSNLPIHLFKNIIRDKGQDLEDLYNKGLDASNPNVTTYIIQAGCVANISVLVCNALNLLEKARFSRIILSGVDYCVKPLGEGRYKTRCVSASFDKASNSMKLDFEVSKPNHEGLEILKIGGVHTDEISFAYYRDLRFINLHMTSPQQGPKVFDIFTSRPSFPSDFLPILPLSSLEAENEPV